MRTCRKFLRVMLTTRLYHVKTVLKVLTILTVITTIFLYIREKNTKETLINLALGSTRVEDLVKPDNDTLIINGLIRDRVKANIAINPFTLIVVTSLPENWERRRNIRESWGKTSQMYGATCIFFMGKPGSNTIMAKIKEETQEYQDLIVDDFEESYYALSIKTLRILKYLKFHHPKTKFLVKTDDDVFVNVPNLLQYLYSKNRILEAEAEGNDHNDLRDKSSYKPSYFVAGVIHAGRGPHTWNPFSKWYAPSDIWKAVFDQTVRLREESNRLNSNPDTSEKVTNPENILLESQYPPYAEGNFYILSEEAAKEILSVSRKVPLFHLEDVYVTGVLATGILKIEKDSIPFISSASNLFPRLSYIWYKLFVPPTELIAYHCDSNVELISQIYQEST